MLCRDCQPKHSTMGLGRPKQISILRINRGHVIPATNEVIVFLFVGPRLYPVDGLQIVIVAFVVILVVSLLSTLYPARIATQVQPVVAMRGE